MGRDLLIAVALVLVIEGVLPFLSPGGMRKAWTQMASLDDRTLRIAGLVSMLAGAIILQFLH